jgi:hypothetical protein
MAQRDTIKQFFETGDKPTQAQFYQLFDNIFFKDEGIAIANITGLVDALNAKADQTSVALLYTYKVTLNADGTYVLPIGNLMDKIIITPAGNSNIKVGTSAGGEEIMPADDIAASEDRMISCDIIARADKTIYFSGITSATTILIFRRTLTSIN